MKKLLAFKIIIIIFSQIDKFGQEQFKQERERLLKLDSLTVLDYIRTSIEILMQIKDEGNDTKPQPSKTILED